MAYAIDTVVKSAGPDAHLQLLDVLRALAERRQRGRVAHEAGRAAGERASRS